VPIGSTVDARKGALKIDSAANGYGPASPSARRQQAQLEAGLFAIRQAKKGRHASARTAIATDIALLSPAGAESACAHGPNKGIVRSVSMSVKGLFRALGGASVATARDASFVTSDRCDGTLTEVGRGTVTLAIKGRQRTVKVHRGAGYLVRARLFAAKKGTLRR
jgi:hypothetical protein